MSLYQKGKANLDFTEARDSEWQWHQLGYMQVCTSLQRDNHASTPPLSYAMHTIKTLLTYYLNISVEAANLSDCQIESKKIDLVARIESKLFFARIGMLYSVDTDEYFHQIATLMLSVMVLLYGVFYDLFP